MNDVKTLWSQTVLRARRGQDSETTCSRGAAEQSAIGVFGAKLGAVQAPEQAAARQLKAEKLVFMHQNLRFLREMLGADNNHMPFSNHYTLVV